MCQCVLRPERPLNGCGQENVLLPSKDLNTAGKAYWRPLGLLHGKRQLKARINSISIVSVKGDDMNIKYYAVVYIKSGAVRAVTSDLSYAAQQLIPGTVWAAAWNRMSAVDVAIQRAQAIRRKQYLASRK
jgi:hypothetical protein